MKEENEELEPCNHVTMVSVYSFEQKATPIFPAYYGSEYEYKINQPIKSRGV